MKLSNEEWLILQEDFIYDEKYESCFTLANGYMGARGTFGSDIEHQNPGTYIAGIFDKSDAAISQLVNMPYFFSLEFYIDGDKVDYKECNVLEFYRMLDMKQGALYTKIIIQDSKMRITAIEGCRFCSYSDRHLAGTSYILTPVNYNASIYVRNIIDACTINGQQTVWDECKHYRCIKSRTEDDSPIYLEVKTKENRYSAGFASTLKIYSNGKSVGLRRKALDIGDKVVQTIEFNGEKGREYTIEKYVAVNTSRDVSKGNVQKAAEDELDRFINRGMDNEFKNSIDSLDKMWSVSNICISGDEKAQKAIRFNIYLMLSSVNPDDEKASLGAKGLHGEGYNGHVFWDNEIFNLPFYIYNNPKAARSLLLYRYNTLDAARENARAGGYKGARYPWESADTGREETPRWGLDYKGKPVRIWTGDIEYHITSDIVYAILQYVRATGDMDFLLNYGAEIIFETSRFWASVVEYNRGYDRYEINDAIGPDEFHEHVNNSMFTNYMARWNMQKGIELFYMIKNLYPEHYSRLSKKINLTGDEVKRWKCIASKIFITNQNDNLVFEQFEGYFKLKDYVITEYDMNNMPVFPRGVDMVKLNDYTLIKQADIVMLLYILGEEFSLKVKKNNFEYYEKRTMHKSSLSPSIYCILGLVVGNYKKSYEYLMRAAMVDLDDNQSNTSQGVHMASAGGTWQAAVFGFGGLSISSEGKVCINPVWMPEKWNRFSYKICWKGCILTVDISKETVTVALEKGNRIDLSICGRDYSLETGDRQALSRMSRGQ
ncbi:MAG: glycosyl hydrolase family 65 protein [Clostridiales bacterium]|nr:glycosyl hydrolase family 65 protein [Clostridiales bacterium]